MRRPQNADRHPLCAAPAFARARAEPAETAVAARRTWVAARVANDTTPRSSTVFDAADATRSASQVPRSYQLRTAEYERDGHPDASGRETAIVREAFHHDRLARCRHVYQLCSAADESPPPDRTPVPTSTMIATPRNSLWLQDACNEYESHLDRTASRPGFFFRGPSDCCNGSIPRCESLRGWERVKTPCSWHIGETLAQSTWRIDEPLSAEDGMAWVRRAGRRPTVVFPEPHTPITTTIIHHPSPPRMHCATAHPSPPRPPTVAGRPCGSAPRNRRMSWR